MTVSSRGLSLTTFPGLAHVQTKPSWQAVTRQSSRKINTVSLSWAIFLHTSGSSSGTSSMRGHSVVPRVLATSAFAVRDELSWLSLSLLLLLMWPMLWFRLWSFSWRSLRESCNDRVANLLTPVAMKALSMMLLPLVLLLLLLLLLPVWLLGVLPPVGAEECGKLLDRGRVLGRELGAGLPLELLLLKLSLPLVPLGLVVVTVVLVVCPVAGGLVALITLVWVLVRDKGRWGKRMSSVRSHRHSCVSWPTEPNL